MHRASLPCLLSLGCGLLFGCGQGNAPAAVPPRLVVTERVAVDDAVDRVVLLGDVHGAQEVRVFAQVPERIRVLHVQEGDRVAAGDAIATLEADLLSTGVVQAEAAVSAASAARDQLVADIARVRRLVEGGAAAPTQLEVLEAQLRTADAQVDQVRAARRTAGEQRDRTVVRAPIDGTVALLSVQQGDMIAPAIPICAIVRAERLRILARVTEQDYVRVRDGMSVEVVPPALPEARRTGTVRRLSPVLDPLTRTASVEVEADNADGSLRPGMVAELAIELSRRPNIVLAPARALVLSSRTDRDGEAAVFVLEGSRARRRTVQLGHRYGQRVEITRGLRGGEELVVQGQHVLRDGAEVRTSGAPPPVADPLSVNQGADR
jgi:RND family efflux transporter MFP subunit